MSPSQPASDDTRYLNPIEPLRMIQTLMLM
jgi:hypothetical protein